MLHGLQDRFAQIERLWEHLLSKDKRSFAEFYLEEYGVVLPEDVSPEDLSDGKQAFLD